MARVLILGLDSADAELIERWCDSGDLPTLDALRREGAYARLGTTAEVMHVSAWPTLYTGATPGRHGMYHAYQTRAGEQGVLRTLPEWCALPPFWKYLDDAGRRCIVMDAFMDYPLDGYRGAQVLEYGTWTWFSEPGSRPRSLRREIVRRFGPYPAPEHTVTPQHPDPAWLRDRLVEGARVKGEAASWMLRAHAWDMAFVTFGETHGGGHYLWHLGDPEHPAHPPGGAAGNAGALRDVYAAVDAAVGRILREVDDSTTVLVVSGDGMGPNYAACQLMPEVLSRLGAFVPRGGTAADGSGAGADAAAPKKKGALLALRNAVPVGVRRAIARCLPRGVNYRLSMKWANEAIDFERSRVFCIYNANEGYFRLNLKGREPRGIVSPGSEGDELLAEVGEAVAELVNPATGRRAADRLHRIDDVFPGPERPHLPDLVATWDAEARVLGTVRSDRCGEVRGAAGYETPPCYTGNHRPNAFVLARGPRTSAGVATGSGHIADLAPTVLDLLEVDVPAHMEGHPWGHPVVR